MTSEAEIQGSESVKQRNCCFRTLQRDAGETEKESESVKKIAVFVPTKSGLGNRDSRAQDSRKLLFNCNYKVMIGPKQLKNLNLSSLKIAVFCTYKVIHDWVELQ